MSNEWELTDAEIDYIVSRYTVNDAEYPRRYRIIARAAQRKLVEWLDKGSMDAHTIILQVNAEDWQALRKEVGLSNEQ